MVSYPILHKSYNEEYFFLTFKIVLLNCIWKFSIILQEIKNTLYECGLNVLWDDQRIAKSDYISKHVKNCLSDKFKQNWNNNVMNSAKCLKIFDSICCVIRNSLNYCWWKHYILLKPTLQYRQVSENATYETKLFYSTL
jgi:hypothetical protein